MQKKNYSPNFRCLLPKIMVILLVFLARPGWSQVLIQEAFDALTLPAGWTATDLTSSGSNWQFNNPSSRIVSPGATNMDFVFAIFDSDDQCNFNEEAALETPAFDASMPGNYRLKFDNSFLIYSGNESAIVEVWNGASWVAVLTMQGTSGSDGYPIANTKVVDITSATGASASSKVRFRYVNGDCDWYWIVDNVVVERLNCSSPAASLTYVPDCTNGSYSVEVNVSSLGSASSLSLAENGSQYGTTITAPGVLSAGPFMSGSVHHLTLNHIQDPACNVALSDLSFYCPSTNQDCSSAANISVSSSTYCSNPAYGEIVGTGVVSQSSDCSYLIGDDLWYSFQATSTTHSVTLTNIQQLNNAAELYLYGIAMYSGNCGALSEIDCATNYSFFSPPLDINYTFQNLTIGEIYYIQVWTDEALDYSYSYVENNIRFQLCVNGTQPPANDECTGAFNISNNSLVSGNNAGATENMPVGLCGDVTANDVWYYFVPAASGNVIVTANSDADLVMELYSGSCGSLAEVDCGYIQYGTTISFNAAANTYYYIRLYGYSAEEAPFLLQIYGGVPLPVNMEPLEGKVEQSIAQLNWRSLAETNNKGFEIQRSADGRTFQPAGFVFTKAKAGNSSEPLSYSYSDPLRISDVAYYRLRQVDMDGTASFSNIVRLVNDAAGTFDFMVMPNPAGNSVTLRVSNYKPGAVISICDITGKTIQTVPVTQTETLVDVSELAAGVYLVRYEDGLHSQTIKLNKL
jgi:hypothetical protein